MADSYAEKSPIFTRYGIIHEHVGRNKTEHI